MNALTLALSAIVLIPRRPGMLAERAQVREGAKAWDRFLAAAIVVVARRELSHHGQPTDPGFPTSHVVPTGVFFVSRNPIYLGAACLLIGIALGCQSPLGVCAPPPGTCRLPLHSDSPRREAPRRQARRGIPYVRRLSPSVGWPRSAPKVTVRSVRIRRVAHEKKAGQQIVWEGEKCLM